MGLECLGLRLGIIGSRVCATRNPIAKVAHLNCAVCLNGQAEESKVCYGLDRRWPQTEYQLYKKADFNDFKYNFSVRQNAQSSFKFHFFFLHTIVLVYSQLFFPSLFLSLCFSQHFKNKQQNNTYAE